MLNFLKNWTLGRLRCSSAALGLFILQLRFSGADKTIYGFFVSYLTPRSDLCTIIADFLQGATDELSLLPAGWLLLFQLVSASLVAAC